MTTKADSNEQMNALIRRPPQTPQLRVAFENRRGHLYTHSF